MNKTLKKLTYDQVEALKYKNPTIMVHDRIDIALSDLFDIRFPSKKDTRTNEEVKAFSDEVVAGDYRNWGSWFYYPWINMIVHFPQKMSCVW
jgi:hypothetical protein